MARLAPATRTTTTRPNTLMARYSRGPNLTASSASSGAMNARHTTLTSPPMMDPVSDRPRASPPRPSLNILWPSWTVAMAAPVPGMPTAMAEIEPPYIAAE